MQLEEIRQRLLGGQPINLEEERFFISSIRRGHTAALETRAKSTERKIAKSATGAGKRKGLDDQALGSLLDGLD